MPGSIRRCCATETGTSVNTNAFRSCSQRLPGICAEQAPARLVQSLVLERVQTALGAGGGGKSC